MIPRIRLTPGNKLIVRAEFLKEAPLFVGLYGPVMVTFSSLWLNEPHEIPNFGPHLWQFFPHASRRGPIGAEVPVTVVRQSDAGAVFAAGEPGDPDALLICDILPAP